MVLLSELVSLIKVILGIYLNRALTGPFTVQLGLSDACNLKCIMCNVFSTLSDKKTYIPGPTPQVLTHDAVLKLIADLKAIGTKKINLVGYGETLIYSKLMDVIRLISQHKIKAYITTNGVLLSREMIDSFVSFRLEGLYISLNAATPKTYQEIHKGAPAECFNKIVENIKYLKEKRRALNKKKPYVCLSFVIMSINCHETREMIALAQDVEADQIIFREVGITSEKCSYLKLEDKHLVQIRENISSFNGITIKNNFSDFLQCCERKKNVQKIVPCYAGFLGGTLITADGSVFPCCNCNKSMGNIYKESFKDIWLSRNYRLFRQEGKDLLRKKSFPSGCACVPCPTNYVNQFVYKRLFFWKKYF